LAQTFAMSSSVPSKPNAPTLSTEHSPDVSGPVSPTGVPTTVPPPIEPPTVPEAKDANPTNEVSLVLTTAAQTAEPIGGTSTAIVSVTLLVSAEAPSSQPTTEVLAPSESTPAVKTAIAVDLTDDRDDADPLASSVTLADGALGASTCSIGRSYYFLVFFLSSYHSFLIRHVAPSHFLFSTNMVLRI
jgi:hypothetical protein